MNKTYADKLRDPRWQRKRLEILEERDFTCEACFETEKPLHVHHSFYQKGLNPWQYPESSLHVLCETCHSGIEDLHMTFLHDLDELLCDPWGETRADKLFDFMHELKKWSPES